MDTSARTILAISANNKRENYEADIKALADRLKIYASVGNDSQTTTRQASVVKLVNDITFKYSAVLQTIMMRIEKNDKPDENETNFIGNELGAVKARFDEIIELFAEFP